MKKFLERTEIYLLQVIKKEKKGLGASIVRISLFLLSRFYSLIIKIRFTLYKHDILLKKRRIGAFVVSIGNVTVGGTGKTPVVEIFARTLSAKGKKVAILSRGYRSKKKSFLQKFNDLISADKIKTPRIVSEGDGKVLLDSHLAGDEPFMLACNVKSAIVLTDKDRINSGRYAIDKYNADILILDDGFQYLKLNRSVNILLVDSTNPFSNHYILPRGLLREPIKNIQRADYIFLTKSNGKSHLRHLKNFLKKHNSKAEIIECCHRPKYLQHVITGKTMPLDELKNKQISSLSGIAVPESFEKFLTDFGSTILHKERFIDHHHYEEEEITSFIEQSNKHNCQLLLTTEKDAVRLPKNIDESCPFYFLRVEIDIISGEENFSECISRLCYE